MITKLAMIIFVFGSVPPGSDDYAIRRAGLAEYQMGHFAKAEQLIRAAMRSAETDNNKYGMALCYAALGDIRGAEGQFPEAQLAYERALSLLSHSREGNHAAAILWRNLGGVLIAESRYDEAMAALKKSSKLVSQNKLEDPQLNALILNSRGMIHYHEKNMAKAERFFLRATQFQFTDSTPHDLDLWEVWNNLGRIYQSTRQYVKAEDAYRRSLKLAEDQFGPVHPSLSVLLDNLGSLYGEIGRYRNGELLFQRSLAILERASSDEIFVMRSLYGLGDLYLREGDELRAQQMLARAAQIASRCVLPAEMREALSVLELYNRALKDSANSPEARRTRLEARRIRASLAFTVPVANAR
jgi:tetratricopeptide (TPR) repeat protein